MSAAVTRIRWPARRTLAFDDGADVEFVAHLVMAGRPSLELERGAPCHHPQTGKLGQRTDDVFGHSVREEFAVIVAVGVDEGQDDH